MSHALRDQSNTHQDRPLKGLALRLVSIALVASLFTLVKYIEERGVHIFEIIFARYLGSAVFIGGWMLLRGDRKSFKTRRMPLHVLRVGVGLIAMCFNMWAVTILPLAEAAVLTFVIPLMSTVLSIFVLKEVVGVRRGTAVVVGFIGVLIAVQPGQNAIPLLGVVVGVIGALGASGSTVLVRKLATTESSATIVFYYTIMGTCATGLVLPFFARVHSPATYGLLVLLGILGMLVFMSFSESVRFADISVLAPIDYTLLIFSAAFGYFIWGDWPSPSLWFGLPFIIGSGTYIAIRQRKLKQMAVK